MKNATAKFFAASLLVILPVSAQSAGKIRVCVDSGNDTRPIVLVRARAIASRMFATAGVALEWHSDGTAACQKAERAGAVLLEFATRTPPNQHPGALAYALPYEGTHIIVLFDRIENSTTGPDQTSNLLAHVMTHEITHLLQGIARHSRTGIMKAQWQPPDLAQMAYHPLPFAPEDIELIHSGMARRAMRAGSAGEKVQLTSRAVGSPRATVEPRSGSPVCGSRRSASESLRGAYRH